MTIAYWCVFAAIFFPYLWVIIAKAKPGYDNRAPRAQLEAAKGFRQRANWAHLNAFEAFPPFAAAVIIAQQAHVTQSAVDGLALAFVGFRIVHGVCYLMNWAGLRSLIWSAGFVCIIGLFLAAGGVFL
jgi:uncharacterized MAPEG superfamily protein